MYMYVMHVALCCLQTEGVMSHSVPNTPSSDLTPTFPPAPVAFSASYPPSSIISPTRRGQHNNYNYTVMDIHL